MDEAIAGYVKKKCNRCDDTGTIVNDARTPTQRYDCPDCINKCNDIDIAIEALDKAKALLILKSKDYNNGPVKLFEYYLFGEKSLIHELHKKLLRLRSLETQTNPNFESKEDTLLDLMNYAAIYYSYLENHKQHDNIPLRRLFFRK